MRIEDSGRSSIVIVQPSTETFPVFDLACVYEVVWVRLNQPVARALVISLAVIQVSNRAPILGNYEIFFIHGIRGMVARCGCMQRW
jgi:hypothetical protein